MTRRSLACALTAAIIAMLAIPATASAAELLERGRPYDPEAHVRPVDLGKPAGPLTVYGRLAGPGEIDVYAFVAPKDGLLPVSLATPAWNSTKDFRPAALVMPEALATSRRAADLPLLIGRATEIVDPELQQRQRAYDPESATTYFLGGKTAIPLEAGKRYAIVIFDTRDLAGPYRLTLGEKPSAFALAWLGSPLLALKLRLGMYGGEGPEAGAILGCLGDLALLMLAVALLVVALRRRAGRTTPEGS